MTKQQYHQRGIASKNMKYGIAGMIPLPDLTLYKKDTSKKGRKSHSKNKTVYVHSIQDEKGVTILNKMRHDVYLEGDRWFVSEKEAVSA